MENRVLPYVWRRIGEGWRDAVPAGPRAEIESFVRELGCHLLGLTRELVAVVERCAQEDIQALPYKGPVLAALFYDEIALRQFRDIDLLVQRQDIPRTCELLGAEGWTAREQLGEAQAREWIERDCELHFDRGNEVALELHWHVLPTAHTQGLRADALWEGLVPTELAGVPTRTFPPEVWLVLLCIHGGDKHRWSRLQMILDVARLLETQPGLSWERVDALARAIGRERSVLLGIFLAWSLLGAPLTPRLLERIAADPRVLARAALLSERPFLDDQPMPSYRAWSRVAALQDESLRNAGVDPPAPAQIARYVVTVLEPEWGDRQAFRLPQGLSFLYWGLRPVRLLARHGLGIVRRIGSLNTE
jgi:hypothetical protein